MWADWDSKRFTNLSSADFDRTFLDYMAKAHENSIKMFRDARDYCSDPDVCHLAARTLPKLYDHQKMIRDLQSGK